MEFSGLISKYPNNRLLTEQEYSHRLDQHECLNIDPHYQLSVIKSNSSYMESVDKWYAWKGIITAVSFAVLLILNATLGWGALEWILEGLGIFPSPLEPTVLLANGIGMALVVSLLDCGVAWLLAKDSFAYTHYPIRFNRKTRTVHVFRTDGTVLSAQWDKIFFTLGHTGHFNEWEVRGHVLEPDDVTVRETFALSYVGHLSAKEIASNAKAYFPQDFVRAHWEFIRRYMEDGPQAVSSQIQFCMPVDRRRESFRVGMERVFANFVGAPFLVYWTMFPFCLGVSVFRWFAMHTSKIPQWPQEVDASCRVESDDPYAIEGASDGERVAVFPEAALAAGVRFCAPPRASTATAETVGRT